MISPKCTGMSVKDVLYPRSHVHEPTTTSAKLPAMLLFPRPLLNVSRRAVRMCKVLFTPP